MCRVNCCALFEKISLARTETSRSALKASLTRRAHCFPRVLRTKIRARLSLGSIITFPNLDARRISAARRTLSNACPAALRIQERFYGGEFDDTKTDAGDREIPLNAAMKKCLEAAWKDTKYRKPDDLVFCARNGAPLNRRDLLKRHLKPTLEKLNLPHCTFHDLRHPHSSLSMGTGASPEVTRDNMGHSTVDVTQNIYTGTWWEQRKAVEGISNLILGR